MEKSTNKFLEFNGQVIHFLAKDGFYWIAIKPICEALDIDFDPHIKSIKNDSILGSQLVQQPIIQSSLGKSQIKNYLCLPEKYIYGWIFMLKGSSKQLHEYQWRCYEILYNHFHGAVGNRKDLIREQARLAVEERKLMEELEGNPEYLQLSAILEKRKKISSELKQLDKGVFTEQLHIFNATTNEV
jgi:hypothetical protein